MVFKKIDSKDINDVRKIMRFPGLCIYKFNSRKRRSQFYNFNEIFPYSYSNKLL